MISFSSRVTFGFLIMASMLVTLSQFFGAPIQCIVEGIPGGECENGSFIIYKSACKPMSIVACMAFDMTIINYQPLVEF